MMAGRIPLRARDAMRKEGKFKPGETIKQAMQRVQAVMVRFGIQMLEVRKEKGGMGLGQEVQDGAPRVCKRCGEEKNAGDGTGGGKGWMCYTCHKAQQQNSATAGHSGEGYCACGEPSERGLCDSCAEEEVGNEGEESYQEEGMFEREEEEDRDVVHQLPEQSSDHQ